MKGILKKVELREFKTSEGKKFKKFLFEVDCIIKDDEIKTLKGSYSEEFARKYFEYCGVKTKELIGKEVGVVTAKKTVIKENQRITFTFIKFINVIDEYGNPIYLPRESEGELDF